MTQDADRFQQRFSIEIIFEILTNRGTCPSQGRFYGGPRGRPQWKMCPPVAPHFGPASLDFHLNRPVISLIQLHIVPPGPQLELWPLIAPPHLASARTAPGPSDLQFHRLLDEVLHSDLQLFDLLLQLSDESLLTLQLGANAADFGVLSESQSSNIHHTSVKNCLIASRFCARQHIC